ncbi:DUF3472 domain-containing protein [Tuwongella immobilis]|uniref:Uncharacterized protein n=1 Tax=Tuwongella immobilis TaxID=692036 RepID=A0A6C2YMM4_9BACT|nr:hypothetical protein [Tuwongella immobilis]VIP02848.1 Uncharacterized protein OS=Planctomyces limnophilus (strain ATCC 43296 / DSM 3776 / IFAM 1008 / 290) GN=Plim_4215 PE=4 SV=1: DUF3472 [Tuwongella immobilis]VTS02632.1 Uncharacterized protein OS=Planctomyces limnophilus (strain ATCC 43296 / DSM 3776 / IFAM 1008 / 290) GN=Plim_4215 PE=4 SV=1: DUF3472 [Tuwongella immobilis]
MRRWMLVIPGLVAAIGLILLADSSVAQAPKAENPYKRMPWHLVDTWWDLGKEVPFESLAIDVTLSDDVPNSVNLYVAPLGIAYFNGTQCYGGIQTNSDGNTKEQPRLQRIGRGLLFSRWDERRIDAIRPADGGWFQSSGHEGDFISVRRPYAWTKGKYTYKLVKMDADLLDGKPVTWIGAFLYSHQKNEHVFIGALRFDGKDLKLGRKMANFVEIYGAYRPVSEIPTLTITFGTPVVNGTPVKSATAEAIYPKGVPDVADTRAVDGNLVIEVGKPIDNRSKRRVPVIPAGG